MKIAVLSGVSRKGGGISYAVRPLCKMLQMQGCDVTIFAPNDAYTREDLPLWKPLSVITYPSYGPLHSSFGIVREIEKMQVDLVHCHGLWQDSQRIALHWHQKTGGPVVISPHGMLDKWALRHSAWKKKLVGAMFANESLQKATCLHALCQSEAESIQAFGLKNPITVIPNGVDLPDLGETHSRLKGVSGEKRRLLFLGRIHPKKGLSELLQAWKLLLERRVTVGETWQLIIAGWDDGGHLQGLQNQATDLGIAWAKSSGQDLSCINGEANEINLVFCGPVFGDDKDALLRAVDAFILPSFSEGLPMSVLEAWAYKLPVLMTDFCNIPEGFTAGAAIQIAPDPHSIAMGMDQLIDLSSSDLSDIGFYGRRLVEQKFQWDKIAMNMKSVFEWCLGGNEPDHLNDFQNRFHQVVA